MATVNSTDPSVAKVSSSGVSERIFKSLLTAILSGKYQPGDKLPTQRELAAEYGVTVTALREGLQRLQQMGLISVRHGSAMSVLDWRSHGGLDVIAHLIFGAGVLDAQVLKDLLIARGLVVKEFAALAAVNRNSQQAQRLVELADKLQSAETLKVFRELDFEFFDLLAESTQNIVFKLIMNTVRSLYLDREVDFPITSQATEVLTGYRAVAAAVLNKDVAEASKLTFDLATAQADQVADLLSLQNSLNSSGGASK